MLASVPLAKWPIQVPNLKSKKKKNPERTSIKIHSSENRFVIRPSNILFSGVHGTLFSPEILQAGAVKGLRWTILSPALLVLPSMHLQDFPVLTYSLPGYDLKTTNKKCEIWTSFNICDLFGISMWKDLHQNAQYWKWFGTGRENILFSDVCVHFSARTFYRLGRWRG